VRAAELALVALTLLSCRREPVESPSAALELEPPLPVEHGPAMPYTGSWVGPELRLQFAGRWVLVEPAQPQPGQAPIELRVAIERREGERAFALRTSIAGVMPVDFLRPSDWTMLVEDDALALAMGDEPLERYDAVEALEPLVGPASIDPNTLPESAPLELEIACLELASSQCGGFEAEGPRAFGCREVVWATCVAHPRAFDSARAGGELDERAAAPMLLASALATVRWSTGLEAAAPPAQRQAAAALRDRVLGSALALLEGLVERGTLPALDPTRSRLHDHLRAAQREGRIASDAIDWSRLD